jgi:tetratricopeptide (TPR) repeat protein
MLCAGRAWRRSSILWRQPLYYAKRYDDAIAAFRQLADLPPYTLLPTDRIGLARAYAARGRLAEAVVEIEAAIKQQGEVSTWLAELARTHAQAGHHDEARRLLARIQEMRSGSAVNPAHLAFIHMELGDASRAFEELDRAANQRLPAMLWANVDPRFDRVRGQQRFRDVLARIGLPFNQ